MNPLTIPDHMGSFEAVMGIGSRKITADAWQASEDHLRETSLGSSPSRYDASPLRSYSGSLSPISEMVAARQLPESHFSAYFSARTHVTSPIYMSARDFHGDAIDRSLSSSIRMDSRPVSKISDFHRLLKEKKMLQPILQELNWSGRPPGRGQHVEYSESEEPPLEEIGLLGNSLVAEVYKVRCRRVLLARKSMRCGPQLKLKDAILEVEHLQRLRHPHIVQLVGTFTQGRTFSILMYPVADFELSKFMKNVEKLLRSDPKALPDYMKVVSLGIFFGCLAGAITFIHDNTTKHMDIKPQNILVKQHPRYLFGHRVYIADFGISRHFSPLDHSQTDGLVARSPKYCAPEVFDDDMRGRSADIFSLGCVFLEMQTVLCRQTLEAFAEHRSQFSGSESFHENLPRVLEWANHLAEMEPYVIFDRKREGFSGPRKKNDRHRDLIRNVKNMLKIHPEDRPRASELYAPAQSEDFWRTCCIGPPESFQQEDETEVAESGNLRSIQMKIPSNLSPQESMVEWINKKNLILTAASNGHHEIANILLPEDSKTEDLFDFNGWSPLHLACLEGHDQVVDIFLARGADPTVKTWGGESALYIACKCNHHQIAERLFEAAMRCPVDSPPDLNALLLLACKNGNGNLVSHVLNCKRRWPTEEVDFTTALLMAAKGGQKTIIRRVLQDGPHYDSRDTNRRTSLHLAASCIDHGAISILLSNGFDIEAKDIKDRTPLFDAVLHRNESGVKFLLETGANVMARDMYLQTPLHVACFNNAATDAILDALLNKGADIEAVDKDGATPLLFAAMASATDLVRPLLLRGALSTKANRLGETPLHVVNGLDGAQALIDHGADLEARSSLGDTPLCIAAWHERTAIVKLLLQRGANSKNSDYTGSTPLHLTSTPELASELLKSGADIEAKTAQGETPLCVAVKKDRGGILKLLFSAGANVNCRDRDDQTPLHHVTNSQTAALLLRNGADVRARGNDGKLPLDVAVKHGRVDVIGELQFWDSRKRLSQ